MKVRKGRGEEMPLLQYRSFSISVTAMLVCFRQVRRESPAWGRQLMLGGGLLAGPVLCAAPAAGRGPT